MDIKQHGQEDVKQHGQVDIKLHERKKERDREAEFRRPGLSRSSIQNTVLSVAIITIKRNFFLAHISYTSLNNVVKLS